MQNVQNAAEIQQRVINLVELYRTKVGKESQIAKDLAAEYKAQYDQEIENAYAMNEQGLSGYVFDIQIPEEDVDYIRVNEQLLGHFYKEVAGLEAEKTVLDEFLADFYDNSIFTEEEEYFLKSHFKEMVNYINLNPSDDLACIGKLDRKNEFSIPVEILELIATRISLPSGSTVYYPFARLAQFSAILEDNKLMCEDTDQLHLSEKKNLLWAWAKITLFANNNSGDVIQEDISLSHKYDAVVSFINNAPDDAESDIKSEWRIRHIIEAFNNLRDGGKLILLCPSSLCRKKWFNPMISEPFSPSQAEFRKQLCQESTLVEIIQLPNVMKSYATTSFSVIIAEKGRKDGRANLIDARFAFDHPFNMLTPFDTVFDTKAFEAMLNNEGKEVETGLRKMITLHCAFLDEDRILPQIYVIEKPSIEEHPVRLSSICNRVYKKVRQIKEDLPLDTPWIKETDLSAVFKGPLDISLLEKANCPNIPPHTDEYVFDESGSFIEDAMVHLLGNGTIKGYRVAEYRSCIYLDGNNDAVVLCLNHDGIKTALYRATGRPVVIEGQSFSNNRELIVLHPNKDVDIMHLLAILNLPIVQRQMYAHDSVGYLNLNDILVPTDLRVIGDEILRMKREEFVTKELRDNFVVAQKKHKAKLENYQHAMRKHIREISSSVRRMERFINDMDSSEEVKKFLNDRLAAIKNHRSYLSEDIERLNEENTYGAALHFDIDHSLRNYREYFGYDVCPIKYTNVIAKDTFRKYRQEHQEMLKVLDEKSRSKELKAALTRSSMAYVDIAEYNFGKIVRNILENAKKHGFDDFADVNRKDNVIEIALDWDDERQMYRIDFRNNGNPLPEGLTKESYGENRKYAGKTGGTGIGGYEVAENVRHYNGDFSISQDGDWTVVSIYLPKSKTYDERL